MLLSRCLILQDQAPGQWHAQKAYLISMIRITITEISLSAFHTRNFLNGKTASFTINYWSQHLGFLWILVSCSFDMSPVWILHIGIHSHIYWFPFKVPQTFPAWIPKMVPTKKPDDLSALFSSTSDTVPWLISSAAFRGAPSHTSNLMVQKWQFPAMKRPSKQLSCFHG